jgi:predicted metalloprotease with PDZ domain
MLESVAYARRDANRRQAVKSEVRDGHSVADLMRYSSRLIVLHFLAAAGGLFFCAATNRAQDLTINLNVVSVSDPATVRVEGTFPTGSAIWSFRNASGGFVGLGDRIENLSLADANGSNISVRKIAAGEFKADGPAMRFRYDVQLSNPPNPADGSHVSILNSQYGFLMLADLLPQVMAERVRVGFQLPRGWTAIGTQARGADDRYELSNAADIVFMIGRDLKESHRRVGETDFRFVTSGDWPFSGDAVTKVAARIIADYGKRTDFTLKKTVILMLAPYPGAVGAERWSAETRGATTILLLGHHASRDSLLPRLNIVLTHELFHLWVPNALALSGDYDWFFEGFTLYEALCSAVGLGFISFQEYLNTLARVYDSYLATAERDRFSLIESSRRRWTGASSLVYDKGMLVALLFDLKLRAERRDHGSLDDVYRELFRRFQKGTQIKEANDALTHLLDARDGGSQFVGRYVRGSDPIDLENGLLPYGIKVTGAGEHHSLSVAAALDSEQRAVLRSLGYKKTH